MQGALALGACEEVMGAHGVLGPAGAGLLLCGDFNTTHKSGLCADLLEGASISQVCSALQCTRDHTRGLIVALVSIQYCYWCRATRSGSLHTALPGGTM